jgi:hypothetical protein
MIKVIKLTLLVLVILKPFSGFSQTNSIFFYSSGLAYNFYPPSYTKSLLINNNEYKLNKRHFDVLSQNVPGKKKKMTGILFTALGTGLLATGIGLVATADEYYYSFSAGPNGSSSSGDPKGALGVLAIPGSIGFIIPGIIKWHRGAKQMKLSNEKNVPTKTDKIRSYKKIWQLTIGSALPIGKEMSSVFGPGLSVNTGLNIGFVKNKIKFGPSLGLDYFSNANSERLLQMMAGASLGYLLQLNDKKTTYFYPGASFYYAGYKDKSDAANPLITGKGTAWEIKTNLVVKKWIVGVSYLGFNPNSSYSDQEIDNIQKYNILYPIAVVTKTNYKFNLSTFKFSLGIII